MMDRVEAPSFIGLWQSTNSPPSLEAKKHMEIEFSRPWQKKHTQEHINGDRPFLDITLITLRPAGQVWPMVYGNAVTVKPSNKAESSALNPAAGVDCELSDFFTPRRVDELHPWKVFSQEHGTPRTTNSIRTKEKAVGFSLNVDKTPFGRPFDIEKIWDMWSQTFWAWKFEKKSRG